LRNTPFFRHYTEIWLDFLLGGLIRIKLWEIIARKGASIAGRVSQIGYGKERRYSPTVLRNCLADQAEDDRSLTVRCLANFGYSASSILAEVNGTPTVAGVFSAADLETRNAFVCSASQFEGTLKELIAGH
jgi:hypothetical protein